MSAVDQWVKAIIDGAFKGKFAPAIEAVLAQVQREIEEAEAKIPSYWVDPQGNVVPKGTPGAVEKKLGVSEEFIEKLVRQKWTAALTDDLIIGLVDAVMKVVREGKGPTRRNRVGLA